MSVSRPFTLAEPQLPEISLLGPACIQVFDELSPDWQRVSLDALPPPGTDEFALSVLKQCKIVTLGDLCHVTPLVLLTIGVECSATLYTHASLWQAVLQSTNSIVRSILRRATLHLLNDALQRAAVGNQLRTAAVVNDNFTSVSASIPQISESPRATSSSLFVDFPNSLLAEVSTALVGANGQSVPTFRGHSYPRHLIDALYAPLLVSDAVIDLVTRGLDLGVLSARNLSLSARTFNALMRHPRARTVAEIVQLHPRELLALRQFGVVAYKQLISALRKQLAPWMKQNALQSTEITTISSEMHAMSGDPNLQEISTIQASTDAAAPVVALLLTADEALENSRWIDMPLVTRDMLSILETRGVVPLAVPIGQLLADCGTDSSNLVRVINALARAHINTVRDVLCTTVNELCMLRNFGVGSFRALHAVLRSYLGDQLQIAASRVEVSTLANSREESPEAVADPHDVAQRSLDSSRIGQQDLAGFLVNLLERYDINWKYASVLDANLPSETLSPELANLLLGEVLDSSRLTPQLAALSPENDQALASAVTRRAAALLAREITSAASGTDTKSLAAFDDVTIELLVYEICKRVGFPLTGCSLARTSLPRALDVMFQRWGLHDGQPKTLAEIGEQLNVSRERIRQLEDRAQILLHTKSVSMYWRALSSLASAAVRTLGGAATLLSASARISTQISFGGLHPIATTQMLAEWADDLDITEDNQTLVAPPFTSDDVHVTQSAAASVLAAYSANTEWKELITEIQQRVQDSIVADHPEFISAVAAIVAHDISHAPSDGAPRGGLLERLLRTLRDIGHPAHYSEIAEHYRHLYADDHERSDRATHAFLGRFPEVFVLVGRGMYALAENGYDPRINNVAALLTHILTESQSPEHVYDIIHKSTVKYRWQDGSILAGLTTNLCIRPLGSGFYGLVDRRYAGFDPSLAYRDRFGYTLPGRENLVLGVYKAPTSNLVLQLRLTAMAAAGIINFTNQTLREFFPPSGKFVAICSTVDGPPVSLYLEQDGHTLEGLGPWLRSHFAFPRDALFMERNDSHPGEDIPAEYRVTLVPAEKSNEQIRIMRLSPVEHLTSITYQASYRSENA